MYVKKIFKGPVFLKSRTSFMYEEVTFQKDKFQKNKNNNLKAPTRF